MEDRQIACLPGTRFASSESMTVQGFAMFAFFSERLGCVGSILVSLVGTALLILVTWALGGCGGSL